MRVLRTTPALLSGFLPVLGLLTSYASLINEEIRGLIATDTCVCRGVDNFIFVTGLANPPNAVPDGLVNTAHTDIVESLVRDS